MTLFACHFTRAVLRTQNWIRGEQSVKSNVPVNLFKKFEKLSEIASRTAKRRPNIVRKVPHNCTSQVGKLCYM